jgi:hypothetical protein
MSISSLDGAGSPGGVIVHHDHSRRIQNQRALGDLSWVYRRVVHRTVLLHFVGDQVVLPVQEKDAELFNLLVPHRGLAVVEQRLPVARGRPALHRSEQQAASDIAHEAQ